MGATAAAGQAFQGVSAVGNGYVQASALRSQADYAKKVAELNNQSLDYQAKYADEQAADAVSRGKTAALRADEQARQNVGVIRAQASGEGATGSAAEGVALSQNDANSANEKMALTINAWRQSFGFQSKAIALRGEEANNTLDATTKANALGYMAKSSMITGWTSGIGFGMKAGQGIYQMSQDEKAANKRRSSQNFAESE